MVISEFLGAFLQADMEVNVHMLIEGTVTEMIIKLDPTIYRKHVWYNKHGKAMLYVQLKKALYRTLQAELLFLKLLSEALQEWGFMLESPHDGYFTVFIKIKNSRFYSLTLSNRTFCTSVPRLHIDLRLLIFQ